MTIAHGARVVSHIIGRLRVRLPETARNPALLREMCDFVRGLGGEFATSTSVQ